MEQEKEVTGWQLLAKLNELKYTAESRLDKIDNRLDRLETRIDTVEKTLNARIDGVNTRVDSVNTRIDSVNTRIDSLEKSVDIRFKSLEKVENVNLLLTGTILGVLIVPLIAEFIKWVLK